MMTLGFAGLGFMGWRGSRKTAAHAASNKKGGHEAALPLEPEAVWSHRLRHAQRSIPAHPRFDV